MVDERCSLQSLLSNTIVHDVLNLRFGIPQCSEGGWYALIDDLKIASTGQFLEFDKCKIRFNTCRIAIHHESDRACRSDHCDLRIAKPIGRPQLKGPVPSTTCRHKQLRRTMLRLDSHRCDR